LELTTKFQYSFVVITLTNEFGEVVEMPNDGVRHDNNQDSDFIPHISFGSLSTFDETPYCDRFEN